MRRAGVWLLSACLAAAVGGLGAYLAVSFLVERSPEVEVPFVVGLGLSEALDQVNGRGLDLEVRAFVYSDEVGENRIVRQRPGAGTVVKAGRGIGVVLSRGPERHPVPDVRGLPLEEARILLEEAGLGADPAARVHRGPEGEVVAQGAVPGLRLPRGAAVPLVVSAGPRPDPLRMPRVEGLALEDALARLDELGLRAARVEEVSLEDPTRLGRVVSQEPLPGFPAERGEGAVLTVAGAGLPAPEALPVWVTRAFPPGFRRHRVEVLLDRGSLTWALADQWVGAGETFRMSVPVKSGERLRLRIDGVEERP